MNQITAPYNFVPLSGWIFSPDWADKVSHDVPFKDGVSGRLELEITAETPVLVGNEQKPYNNARPNHPGESHFCQINNRYAIPGTTLKGMIRNVLEIAAFGKMGYVDDRRLGIRDITSNRVKERNYPILNSNNRNQKAGFLRLCENGKGRAEIVPCKFAFIKHADMGRKVGEAQIYIFTQGMSVREKYRKWESLAKSDFSKRGLPLYTAAIDGEQIRGELVFTGQISDKIQKPKEGKARDFLFYDRKENEVKPVSPRVLADFRFIHGEHDKKHNGPWPKYWQEKFFKGGAQGEIPVFYQCDHEGNIKSIGLAFMYKLAYEYSIGETITHTNKKHRDEDLPDLAEVLFGKVHSDSEKNHLSLKSRVSFGACFAPPDTPEPTKSYTTVLNGPKPTYFPNYVRQDKSPRLDKEKTDAAYHYRTYMQHDSEIRGWKRYPVRLVDKVDVPESPPKSKASVQIKLFPLPENTVFKGTVRFHNLRPQELGALLWALEWGGEERLRHNLGMGKPLGFGVVKLKITGGELRRNTDPMAIELLDAEQRQSYRQGFVEWMNQAYRKAQNPLAEPVEAPWEQSAQIVTLQAMANPAHDFATQGLLRHLVLDKKEFNEAKQKGLVLPEYEQLPPQQERADWRLFPRDYPPPPEPEKPPLSPVEAWLEEKIAEVQRGNTQLSPTDALTSKVLAEKHWANVEDSELKQQLRDYIKQQWRAASGDPEVDWWEVPVSKGMRQAKKIYTQG